MSVAVRGCRRRRSTVSRPADAKRRRPGGPASSPGGRSAGDRATGPNLGRHAASATFRVVDIGSEPKPRPAGRETGAGPGGPRHRRPAARPVPPAKSGPTHALPVGRRSPRAATSTSLHPELLAVVQERRAARVSSTTAAARAIASRSSPPTEAASASVTWLIVVRERRRSASGRSPKAASRSAIGRPDRAGRPRRPSELPVEDEVPIGGQAGRRLDRPVEQLADRHPAGLLVDDRPERPMQLQEVGLVAIVDVDLAVPGRRPRLGRVGAQLRVLEERVEDVEPKAVDATRQPAADHLELGLLDAPASAS